MIDELAWCAVRYALGRMTYVSHSVPRAVLYYKDRLETFTLKGIIRDIEEHKRIYGAIGMDCDERSWFEFRDKLIEEVEGREHGKRETLRN